MRLLCLGCVTLLAFLALGHAEEEQKAVSVGEKVPNVSVTDLNGKARALTELIKGEKEGEGKPLVLMFWCTTCHSCRDAEPQFEKFAQAYKDKAVIGVVSVNKGESAPKGAEWAKQHGFTFSVFYDATGKIADLFKVENTTVALVIDANGVLRYVGQFRMGEKRLAENALKAVLAGQEVETKQTIQSGCPLQRK